jgi:hypothetical protein
MFEDERGRPAAAAGKDEPLGAFDAAFRGKWTWMQPSWRQAHWRLLAGDVAVGVLDGRGFFRTPRVARFADATWTLRHDWTGRTRVFAEGRDEPVAVFRSRWFGRGVLEAGSQPPLVWRRESLWRWNYAFFTPELLPLVHFRTRRRAFRHEAAVELEDAARTRADLPMLLALGWLLLLHAHRSASHHGWH